MIPTASNNLTNNILVVDNDSQFARLVQNISAQRNCQAFIAPNKKRATEHLEQNQWNLIFVNQKFACDQNGHYILLEQIKSNFPEMPVIVISDDSSEQHAFEAFKAGATEFIAKPLDAIKIEKILDIFLPNHQTQSLASASHGTKCLYNIIGQSPALANTVELAHRAAPTSAPIMITGQTGTGKELIAQLIHRHSHRHNGPFVKINCASLSETLLESELFGHEKGAFTGADNRHQGRFERAHGGTLLLDEITETQPRFQAHLLRALEQMNFERVGGTEKINVNVRVISTTNKNILDEIKNNNFRSDLYYRLAGIRLNVPALKDRIEDLPLLIWHFVNQFACEVKRPITGIDRKTLEIFNNYNWPGNIRQLRNVLRTAMVLGTTETLTLSDAPWLLEELMPSTDNTAIENFTGDMTLQQMEKNAILASLQRSRGNQTQAANTLGITPRTLRDKMKKYRQQEELQLTA